MHLSSRSFAMVATGMALLLGLWGVAAQAQTLASGARHALALTHDGRVLAWGDNRLAQLGQGKTAYAASAREIAMPARMVAVRAGLNSVLALDEQGSVWTWGTNRQGQLGDGTRADRGTPRIVFRGATAIVNGDERGPSFAIDAEGQPWWWGPLPSGTLALLPERAARVPARLIRIQQAASTTVALDDQGTVWSWGEGVACAADAGPRGPETVAGLPPIADLVMQGYTPSRDKPLHDPQPPPRQHGPASLVQAVDRDGTHWQWGDSPVDPDAGRMPQTRVRHCPPGRIEAVYSALQLRDYRHPDLAAQGVQIARVLDGDVPYLGLTAEGELWQWEHLIEGHPRDGRITLRRVASGVADASAYASQGNPRRTGLLYITRDGRLYGQGANTSLHLASGDGELDSSSSPRAVPLPGPAASVHTRPYGSYALLRDGRLFRWGLGAWTSDPYTHFEGGVFPQDPVHQAVPARLVRLATSHHRWLAVDDEGKVWTSDSWGAAAPSRAESSRPALVYSQGGMPAMRDVAMGGHDHAALLAVDGSVWDLSGEPGVPVKVQGLPRPVLQIAAMGDGSARATYALDAQGTVWYWGLRQRYGTTGPRPKDFWGGPIKGPTALSLPGKAVSIHANDYSLCAILQDGSAQCIGKIFKEHEGVRFALHAPIRELSFGVDGMDDPEYVDQRGVEHFGTVHFRLADGTVWAWGRGRQGQLGNGTYASATATTPVINEAGTGDLDLDPTVANARAPNRPAFRMNAWLRGNPRAVSLGAQVFGSTPGAGPACGRQCRLYALLISGTNPGAGDPAQQGPWVALDGQGTWGPGDEHRWSVPSEDGQRMPQGERQSVQLRLLRVEDGPAPAGMRLYLGYGRDVQEMRAARRYREVLELAAEDVAEVQSIGGY